MKVTRVVCLCAAAALLMLTAACGADPSSSAGDDPAALPPPESISESASGGFEVDAESTGGAETILIDGASVGEGNLSFALTITDEIGSELNVTVHTDRSNIGEALTDLGIIAGEEGVYGLYVKTVNGISLDFSQENEYWAFYVNGEYTADGPYRTEISDGSAYAFRVQH